ncbi:Diacetylchitobiose uptake system permease protein NgcG [Paenibacillus allorhizoplanae]|uniref:Diacetylchitobiose uptake system permease protein NgcG n=1 Tax=Paenibacillus allorhizoplanae TaxID=2905648 RepID=A0ABN8GT96_9BACL|nr:carbohydrate ABC transporter permease [Paenibacillus allorhizoplanae]CAH1217619.1 Diacetylchitobiose uptake system permease protein NgcG [Paenibacillus allorhizoplanae]
MEIRTAQRTRQSVGAKMIIHLLLMVWSVISLFPIIWMLSTSLKEKNEIYTNASLIPRNALNFKNYIEAWNYGGFKLYVLNSLFYTTVVVVGVVLIASLAAYAISRLELVGKKTIYYVFMGTMMIPVPGAFISLFIVVSNLGLANTRLGYMLPLIAISLPISIFILKSFFDELPKEIEESAIIDGARSFQIYYKIMIPLARSAIATIVILNMLSVWNEFLLALVMFSNNKLMPIQMGLSVFVGQYTTQYELLMAAMSIMVIPVILVYVLMQKQFIQGITSGAIKG